MWYRFEARSGKIGWAVWHWTRNGILTLDTDVEQFKRTGNRGLLTASDTTPKAVECENGMSTFCCSNILSNIWLGYVLYPTGVKTFNWRTSLPVIIMLSWYFSEEPQEVCLNTMLFLWATLLMWLSKYTDQVADIYRFDTIFASSKAIVVSWVTVHPLLVFSNF